MDYPRYVLFVWATLVIMVGAIVPQIFLSKKLSKWPGRILPAITLILSLWGVADAIVTSGLEQAALAGICVWVFLLSNISTVILLTIYAACRKKGKRKSQIDKMSIQDL